MRGGKLELRKRMHNPAKPGLLNYVLYVTGPAVSLNSLRRRFP